MTIKELLDNWKKEHGIEDEDAYNVLVAFVEYVGTNEDVLETLFAMFGLVTIGDFLADFLETQTSQWDDEGDSIDEDSAYLANQLP